MNNTVQLMGNVGKDTEVKYNPNGTVVANFVIATNDGYKNSSGQWIDRTTWHNIECWGELAKRVEKFIQKGTNLTIRGRLAVDSWEDKEGNKHYKTYVQMKEFVTHKGAKTSEKGSYDEMENL